MTTGRRSAWSAWTIATVVAAAAGIMAFTSQRAAQAAAWIDVTATLDPATTPIYEGDAPMRFEFLKDMRRGDALTLSAYSLGAHSGTHIDAPMHFVRDGASIEQLLLAPLIGPARVIDIPDDVQSINAAELNR